MNLPKSNSGEPAPVTHEVVLQPGEYFVGGADCRIRTLLGSCVSIVLWDPQERIGAMSHFLLARRPASCRSPSARYAEDSFALMAARLRAKGVDYRRCNAKIFGGGDMFAGISPGRGIRVGLENGQAARTLLTSRGIRISGEHLFGEGYRIIVFEPATGVVWMRHSSDSCATPARGAVH